MATIEVEDTVRIVKPGHEHHGRTVVVDRIFAGDCNTPAFVTVGVVTSNGYDRNSYTGITVTAGDITLIRKGNADLDACNALFARMDRLNAGQR